MLVGLVTIAPTIDVVASRGTCEIAPLTVFTLGGGR
jgi:hypothetical protein